MNTNNNPKNQEESKENCDNNKNPIFLKWVEKIKTMTCVWLLSVWLAISWNVNSEPLQNNDWLLNREVILFPNLDSKFEEHAKKLWINRNEQKKIYTQTLWSMMDEEYNKIYSFLDKEQVIEIKKLVSSLGINNQVNLLNMLMEIRYTNKWIILDSETILSWYNLFKDFEKTWQYNGENIKFLSNKIPNFIKLSIYSKYEESINNNSNKNISLEEKIENILSNLDERVRESQRKKIEWFNPNVSKELVECIKEAEKIIIDKSDKNKMKLTITLITFFSKVDTVAWSSNEYYEIVIEKFPELKWTELWKKLNNIANNIVILNLQKKLNWI